MAHQISPIMRKVLQLKNSGACPIVRFNKNLKRNNGYLKGPYFEPNMVARIVRAEVDYSSTVRITFDETGFESINDALASTIYENKEGVVCLKAKEFGICPENGQYSLYLDHSDDCFELIDSNRNALMEKYLDSPESNTKTYCEWLEDYVIKLEGV